MRARSFEDVQTRRSDMSHDLDHLIELQQLETAAEGARRLVAATPQRIAGLDAQLAAADAALATAREQKVQSETERRTLEKDLAAIRARRSKFLDQTIEVKTNREYHALQHEIQMADDDIKRLEDRILENMLALDDTNAAIAEAEAARTEAERAVTAQKQTLEIERKHAEASLAEIAKQREAVLARISPQAYAIYDTVSRGRKSPAVAAVVGGLCSVCHVRIRPQIDQDVRRREQIVQCESCTRILYHPALHQPAVTPPA
ncbi:MAG TPA: C4-type zinc ribbon domain-containing protein [Vicinamibacterales bacterium]|nr:C4-type zinc ribbon domain-containing protein [Vicinamibacterales bacterium]